MVSIRCKLIVKSALEELSLNYGVVELGSVEVKDKLTDKKRKQLKTTLLQSGLELMDNKKAILIEKIKSLIIEMIHYDDELPSVKKSIYISEKLKYDYTYLANVFSEVTGTTIEHFIIAHKIERVKELLLYDELNMSEIAIKLHYSSLAHLSNQFKKVTGLTPPYFKKLKLVRQRNLENVGMM